LKAYILLGIEPEFDVANPYHARQSLLAAEFVVAMTAYTSDSLYEYANVILPIATFAETSGTYINLDQTWQTVAGTLPPQGQARPAWKVVRVLGNLMHCKGFEYLGSEEITQEISQKFATGTEIKPACYYPDALPLARENLTRIGEWPLYRIDPIVRRSHALQTCGSAEVSCIRVHPDTAKKYGLTTVATISQSDIEITLPLEIDERIVRDAVWVANGMPETIDLGHSFAAIMIKP
jgi:NADH-quinone oxidoreductase subunit G